VATLSFDTGNEAHAFEAALHDIYKADRLDTVEMALFHTKGGFAECYPTQMIETLLAELGQ
jgi:hypothetical protein